MIPFQIQSSFFYIAEYAISILENLEVMGFPIPDFLRIRFKKMAENVGKENDKK
ncbi:phage holin family protein [Levilactobacillus brevis]|uniref:phage holin family protein n=1 Tax=Levilactobacillus brevis TaxID=1580 RepID=UPI0004B8538F